ncbi:MAG: C39 family peptidase, partial [Myxococcota bacterium]
AQGQSPGNLENLYRAKGLYATSTYSASESTIKYHLDKGRPVVVHGNFTSAGHIVLFIGYDATGWYVNDPAGRWAGCWGCGYPNRTSANGKGVHYSYASVRSVIGTSGDIWISVADKAPL